MSARSVSEALIRCASTRKWARGMCGQFCAAMYGYGFSGYVDAVAQWRQTPSALRWPGSTDAPPGALLFWKGGSQGHGHVAVADGVGGCWSIDIAGAGTVARVPAGTISARWGLPYLGWTAPYFQGKQWSPMGIHGTDVSSYQPVNFRTTLPQSGEPIDFAIIKITEGTGYVNPRWTGQRLWAQDHGMSVGFYHFARPGNMFDQADYFLSKVKLQPGDHLWFDWEDAGVSSAQKDQWIRHVQDQRPGHRVGLYCNTSFWKSRDVSSFAGDGLWIATGGYPAGSPPVASPWLIHQYSTAGSYDHDVAQFTSKDAMLAWAGGEDDMALSDADIEKIAKKVLTLDGVLESAADSPDHETNPYWSLETHTKDTNAKVRYTAGAVAQILAQVEANGDTLSTVRTLLESLDLSDVPAQVAAKIEALKLVVTVEEQP